MTHFRPPGFVALAAAALALAACTVGPDFQRPAAPDVKRYTAAADAGPAADAASGAAAAPAVATAAGAAAAGPQVDFGGRPQPAWWQLFGSTELDDVVRQAVAGNPGLVSARATLAQAGELATAASGNRYPQVSLNAGAGRQQYGAQFLGSFKLAPFTAFGAGPAVSYVLDYDGGARRTDEQAAAQVQYQQSQLDAAYLALTGNVVLQAIAVAATRAQIDAVQQMLTEDADNLRLVQSAFDAGAVSRADLVSARSQQAADQTLLPPLRQQLSEARHRLSLLSGNAPAQWVPPDFELAHLALPAQVPVSLPSDLVHQRPDILSAEAQLHAATAAVGIATANLYPRIQLTAGISQQALRPEALFNGASTAWSLLSTLSAPLFDGGTRRAEKRAAIDAMQARAADYRQTVLSAFGQVADLLDALQHDAQEVAAETASVNAAQDNIGLARASYAAGNTGLLQLLDAQRQHEQAQLGLLRARAHQYRDIAQLLLAMGGSLPERS